MGKDAREKRRRRMGRLVEKVKSTSLGSLIRREGLLHPVDAYAFAALAAAPDHGEPEDSAIDEGEAAREHTKALLQETAASNPLNFARIEPMQGRFTVPADALYTFSHPVLLDGVLVPAGVPVDVPHGALLERCEVTGNPCGTDTWAAGSACRCAPCQRLVAALKTPTPAQ